MDYLNPGNSDIRVNTIIPLTQKIVYLTRSKKLHLVCFPDVDFKNYIYNSYLGGNVVIGKENGIENSILIGNGQIIKFGKYNSLQNLEAHGSDIRKVGVEWGNGNFIAHRGIFHGCKGGNGNYLGVGTIIADLTNAGSKNYFYHGTTIGFNNKLKDGMAYKGSYISEEKNGNFGFSKNAVIFENQITHGKISLGELFHDRKYLFMRDIIIPRTKDLLNNLAYFKGGFFKNNSEKIPAMGILINHVLMTAEYYHGLAAKIMEKIDIRISENLSSLQSIYSGFLSGKIDLKNEVWDKREFIYKQTNNIFKILSKSFEYENKYSKTLINLNLKQQKILSLKKTQKIFILNFRTHAVGIFSKDILYCIRRIFDVHNFLNDFVK